MVEHESEYQRIASLAHVEESAITMQRLAKRASAGAPLKVDPLKESISDADVTDVHEFDATTDAGAGSIAGSIANTGSNSASDATLIAGATNLASRRAVNKGVALLVPLEGASGETRDGDGGRGGGGGGGRKSTELGLGFNGFNGRKPLRRRVLVFPLQVLTSRGY